MVKMLLQILAWLVRFLAWLFAVGTVTVLGVCWMRLTFVPRADRHCTMMTDGFTDALGLTYVGWRGAILAFVEFFLVLGALWASRTCYLASRSIGHLILILWAGLWMANAFYVFADGTFDLIYILPFVFLCTCLRAALDLCRPSTPVLAERPV